MRVRVIEYALPGQGDAQSRYRLMTTLLDATQAPALDLAAPYQQRWQVESVFDKLKTHLLKGCRVLRSNTPALVQQEFYGWVLAHYAVRWLLHQGAARYSLSGCTRGRQGTAWRTRSCPSRGMCSCYAAPSPAQGPFPPARPRSRRRWFNELVQVGARLRAVRTLGQKEPRMVKRRHSPLPRMIAKHPSVDRCR